jgi:GNAT superfamily N-acetyltransferase
MEIRPLQHDDVAATAGLAHDTWGDVADDRAAAITRRAPRIAHLLQTDPAGAWVAIDADDEVAGCALALVRDGVWGLSLLVVREDARSRGIGRRLLDAALGCGDGTRGGIVLSSTDPRAMRRYAHAGFELHPCVGAGGIVDRRRLGPAPGVREGTLDDVPATAAASRHVRGASHERDLPALLADGHRLLVHERGFAVHEEGSPKLLAASDEPAAEELLWACLAASPRGGSITVEFVTAGQDWAIRTLLRAGLALSPDGPVFVRGRLGPLRPYLPSGAYL